MPLPRMTTRRWMIAVAVAGLALSCFQLDSRGRTRALHAAKRAVPGLIVESIQPEQFGSAQAWEIRGTDPAGTEWMLDVSPSGVILMKEAVAFGPPRSVIVPYGQ